MDGRKKPRTEPPPPPALARTVTPWLSERGIVPPAGQTWRVELCLDAIAHSAARVFAEAIDTRFRLVILPDGWAYYFSHAGRVTQVRVTDVARSAARDDHNLSGSTPPLETIGTLVRQLEQRFGVSLARSTAMIETSLPGTEPIIRAWVMRL